MAKTHLSTREKEILTLMDHYNFVSNEILIFLLKFKQSAYKYATKLRDKNLIESEKYNGMIYHFLTPEGHSYLRETNDHYYTSFKKENIHTLNLRHIKCIQQVEISLARISETSPDLCQEIIAEKYLLKRKKKLPSDISENGSLYRIPDGAFDYKGAHVCYEVELSVKSKNRYYHIFNFFRDFTGYQRVFWFYEEDHVREKLLAVFVDAYYENYQRFISTEHENKISRNGLLHCFIKLEDFIENGFDAKKIYLEDRLKKE